MRVAIVALASAGVLIAGAWWLGRDAKPGAVGVSTTVELAAAESLTSAEAEPDAAGEAAPEPSAAATEETNGGSSSHEAAPPRSRQAAATPPRDIPEEWVPAASDFAEGGVDANRGASKIDAPAPIAPSAANDASIRPPTQLASAIEQDAWRDRIRRMLDVYRRVAPPQ
jgi:hypothetical protein